jgi:hypothetical protein
MALSRQDAKSAKKKQKSGHRDQGTEVFSARFVSDVDDCVFLGALGVLAARKETK